MSYIKHSKEAVDAALSEIKDRQEGNFHYIPTGITKLDDSWLGGLEPWRIITLAGMSGAGKSTFLEQIVDNLFLNGNPRVLNFSFEMLGKDSMLRIISNRLGIDNKTIFESLNLEDEKIKEVIKSIKSRDYYIVDEVLSISEMENVIEDFISNNPNRFNIITLDHTLLCKTNKQTEVEKAIIDELYRLLVRLKKKYFAEGKKVSFILLSQLNREIENKDRVLNTILHYPNRNDLFAASSTYYSSDTVIIIHCPANISGIGSYYGPSMKYFPKGLPVKIGTNRIIYCHIIKNRFSVPNRIIPFLEQFSIAKLTEIELIDENTFKTIT